MLDSVDTWHRLKLGLERPLTAAIKGRMIKCVFFLEVLALTQILQYLKKHGQRLDSEIARETGLPLATVRERVATLRASGDVITCELTRFEDGKPLQAWVCRVSGYTPPAAPGRKAKPTTSVR